MNRLIKNKPKYSHTLLLVILSLLLVLGIFFRFVNIDKKFYWADEASTSLRISGHTASEAQQQIFGNPKVFTPKDLQKYQYPNPEKSLIDTIKCLALEDPQNGPFYFIVLRLWLQWFGNSVAATRGFSVAMSLLAFPCIYWLCQELFRSPIVGWVAIALMAVSPIHVLYAQEARPYSLWIVTILLSSATLLRAMRVKTKISWLLYAIMVMLGVYTHLVFGLVAIGHGIYLFAMERCRWTKTTISGLGALLAGLLTFVPWIIVILRSPANLETAQMSWIDTKQTFGAEATRWAAILSRTFIDLGIGPSDALPLRLTMIPLILGVLLLLIYAIYAVYRKAPKRIWLFVFTLIGSVGIPLMVIDFVFSKRYGTTRYLLPSAIGIQLCFAYLFATKITVISARIRSQKIHQGIAAIVIAIGLLSCAMIAQSEMWWNKLPMMYGDYPQEIRIINQAKHPLVLSSNNLIEMLMLSHRLDPKVQLIFLKGNIPKIPDGVTDVFVHNDVEELAVELAKAYNTKSKRISTALWKLENTKIR